MRNRLALRYKEFIDGTNRENVYQRGLRGAVETPELNPGLDARPWIEIIAQCVSDKIKREHGEHHGGCGK